MSYRNFPPLFSCPAYVGHVHVVGDPENAAYEWEHRDDDGRKLAGSKNAFYGSPGPAMRDGLLHALGGGDLLAAARRLLAFYAPAGETPSFQPYADTGTNREIEGRWLELRALSDCQPAQTDQP